MTLIGAFYSQDYLSYWQQAILGAIVFSKHFKWLVATFKSENNMTLSTYPE